MIIRRIGILISICLICVPVSSFPEEVPPGMVLVKGGTYLMGKADKPFEDEPTIAETYVIEEEPEHEVTLKSFYIGKYEVTQAEWEAVMGSNPALFKGETRPVERVDWYSAVEYCNRRSRNEGLTPCYTGKGDEIVCDFQAEGYRLLTEAEWEYACRGGQKTRHYMYSGSNELDEVGWYEVNSGIETHPVGQKKPNELGIYDMSGNVWEWCWDWYDRNYYKNGPRDNPTGPQTGPTRMYRGGGAESHYFWLSNTGRYTTPPSSYGWFFGFRVAKIKNSSALHPEGMILVEGGTYRMGNREGGVGEKPAHRVTVRSFMMGKYEVTQEEWMEVMGKNPAVGFLGAKLPVQTVSWYEITEYCNKRSQKEGLTPCYTGKGDGMACDFEANGYRLPTEAEWEYAGRGGSNSQNYKYSGSNNLDEVAWHPNNAGGAIHPVGRKKPNELGIYDMSGNMWEWCWDWYKFEYYRSSPGTDPRGPSTGLQRVKRGGSIAPYPTKDHHWSTFRFYDEPHLEFYTIGFRVVRTVK